MAGRYGRYEAKRDPYSDRPCDWVVWDNQTWQMPFDGTRTQCQAYSRARNSGRSPVESERAARGGSS